MHDPDDLLALRPAWSSKVVLAICSAPCWTQCLAALKEEVIWIDFDVCRQQVLAHVKTSPWWSLYKLQSITTLMEASVGPWAYRIQTLKAVGLAVAMAHRQIDFRPIVVRVPPLDALEYKLCLETCLEAKCCIVVPKGPDDLKAAWKPEEPWYRALPFFSTLFEVTE